ncbi:MAG: threonine/serine exporter family protein [Acetobacteraceae bacterium]
MSQPASSLPPLLQPARADPAAIDDVAHLALLVGRLLLLNGADTASVQQAMLRFSEAFGYEAHVLVTYEALLLTVVSGAQFRTKIGHPVPAMGVSMRIVTAVNGLVEQVERGGWSLAQARDALDGIGLQPPHYPRWLVVAAPGPHRSQPEPALWRRLAHLRRGAAGRHGRNLAAPRMRGGGSLTRSSFPSPPRSSAGSSARPAFCSAPAARQRCAS